MSTNYEPGHTNYEPGHTEETATPPRRLMRSSSDRMLAGVAAGIADYFGIDPSIVRIAFVVLALIGGLGVILYMAGWLLMPEESDGVESDVTAEVDARRSRRAVMIALPVLAVLFVVFALTPWWRSIAWYPGIGWLIFAAVALLLIVRHAPRPSVRRVLAATALAALTFVFLTVAVVLSTVALSGVPLRGGIGDHQWRPSSMAELQKTYRTAIGNSTLDLRQVQFTGSTRITATVGIGRLLVEVPPQVVVNLNSHAGIGDVTFGPGGSSAFYTAAPGRTSAGHLTLTAQVGIGQVELIRGSSNSVVTYTSPAPTPPAPPAPRPTVEFWHPVPSVPVG